MYYSCQQNKKNKSPGLDGITIEFYQTFWHLIGPFMIDVFNESFKAKKLSDSQRKAVMTLIFKKGATDDIKNYRPISLTNVDYRIIAFTLSERVQKVIDNIVCSDQSAYIRGRYMGTNIRVINDIINHYDMTKQNGFLFMLDFQKAFDSIEWSFLYKTLNYFNFGPDFINWIKTLYNSPEAIIKNNGYLSDSFAISRGVRQGCPVSALLFVLCVEILAIHIRSNKSIKGFNFGFSDKTIKIIQYADDMVLFLNDKNELCSAINILESFGKKSGLILNIPKCEGLMLGKDLLSCNSEIFGIKWLSQIRCLGVYLGYDTQENETKNFTDKIKQIETLLKGWQKRDLTLFGKILIIKALALSKLVLPMSLLVMPDKLLKMAESIFYRFIWGKSKDRVRRANLIKDIPNGGLNMVHLKSFSMSLLARWVHRILQANPNDAWVQLPNLYLKPLKEISQDLIFNFDDSVKFQLVDELPMFYSQVIKSFNKAYVLDETKFKDNIMNQVLWGNKFLTIQRTSTGRKKKDTLYLRNWIRSGINKISDLKFNNGVLDMNYTIETIQPRNNIYCDVLLVRNALYPFQDVIRNRNQCPPLVTKACTSKDIYLALLSKMNMDNLYHSAYLSQFGTLDEEELAFRTKVFSVREIKLKEFNFKVLHGILPCNNNLVRWKIKTSNSCDVCNESQTIKHLLFDCSYVKPLWNIVNTTFSFNISYKQLLGMDNDFVHNDITTLIAFIIYKEWVVLSLENKVRSDSLSFEYFKNELILRNKIYSSCKSIPCTLIEEISYLTSLM